MRAVIMTGFVPAIGFVPMAIATGTGAAVQKPLATTVIGGLLAATILTLLVLPAIAKVVLGSTWTLKLFNRQPDSPVAPVTAKQRSNVKSVRSEEKSEGKKS